ncbi:MAG: hypothetical protein R2909_11140 [Gemmatimonadales bacterium]
MSTEPTPIEARTGLPPFRPAEMPEPPRPKGLGWIPVVGPGVILLGRRSRERRGPCSGRP